MNQNLEIEIQVLYQLPTIMTSKHKIQTVDIHLEIAHYAGKGSSSLFEAGKLIRS